MRLKKTVTQTFNVETRTICDECGKNTNWTNETTGRGDEVTIEAKIGPRSLSGNPEDDYRDVYEIDLCGPCFTEKVLPALDKAGLKWRVHDINQDVRAWDPEP